LFETRGQYGVYDPNRPDDHSPGNYPKVLLHDGQYIGVVRIDVAERIAYLRRVAIDAPHQRQGFGRILLALAEDFAGEHGAVRVESAVALDAVPFYRKCGYRLLEPASGERTSVPMYKELAR
jgi:GNAT superfamily N-acetyltransferase